MSISYLVLQKCILYRVFKLFLRTQDRVHFLLILNLLEPKVLKPVPSFPLVLDFLMFLFRGWFMLLSEYLH